MEVWRLDRQIERLRKRVDAVVVVFHGGREYLPVPTPYVVGTLRAAADAGADAVIAHHPHVPQGIEIYGDRQVPIVYSQGNCAGRATFIQAEFHDILGKTA